MTASLTKVVPAHRHTIEFLWVKPDFMLFGTFKAARTRMGLGIMDKCFWCKKPFADADMMALAGRAAAKNCVLCQDCVRTADKDTVL